LKARAGEEGGRAFVHSPGGSPKDSTYTRSPLLPQHCLL